MFEKRCNEIKYTIENELIREFGVAYFSFSEQTRYALILKKLHECMKEQRERQD